MKLYAVTKGDYSNYHIITLTQNRNTAKALAKRFSDAYDEAAVETWEDGQFLMGGSIYRVWSYGTEIRGCELDESDYNVQDIGMVSHISDKGNMYVTYVIAGSEEQASKIGKDRIVKHIAGRIGL